MTWYHIDYLEDYPSCLFAQESTTEDTFYVHRCKTKTKGPIIVACVQADSVEQAIKIVEKEAVKLWQAGIIN